MKDAEAEAIKDRCEKYFDKWIALLGLDNWRGAINYMRETRAGWVMEARPKWEYLIYTINVNVPSLANSDDDDIEYYVVHELMHVLLHEMRSRARGRDSIAHEERTAVILARAFIRVNAKKKGKK